MLSTWRRPWYSKIFREVPLTALTTLLLPRSPAGGREASPAPPPPCPGPAPPSPWAPCTVGILLKYSEQNILMGPIWNDLLYPPPDPGARAAGGVGAELGVAGAARAADQRAEVLEAEDGAPVEQEVARAHEDHAHQVHQVKLHRRNRHYKHWLFCSRIWGWL